MKVTKDVIESAIKVREKEVDFLKNYYLPYSDFDQITADSTIENLESQIAELKQSLQTLYNHESKQPPRPSNKS